MKNKKCMKAAVICLGLAIAGNVSYSVRAEEMVVLETVAEETEATETSLSSEATETTVSNDVEVDDAVIYDGVYVGDVSIGGMTMEEAKTTVNEYMNAVKKKVISLKLDGIADESNTIMASAEELGLSWANPEVLDEVSGIGKTGNVVSRYKMMKDIEFSPIVYNIEFAVDKAKIDAYLQEHKGELEVQGADATLQKTAQGFVVKDGTKGVSFDVAAAAGKLETYLLQEWNKEDAQVLLESTQMEPKITKEMCEKIATTPMGTYTTTYYSSSSSRSGNIDNAVNLINGAVVLPGEEFSCLDYMLPFTSDNGYFPAGSYLNGKLVDSLGGGVCQVSTTLYNALLLAEVEITSRSNHGLTVGYVPLSADAAIAESSGMDLKFINNTNAPIYIEGTTQDKTVTFNVYGYDERPANRTISYWSQVDEVLSPGADVVTIDNSMAPGSRYVTQSSHTGYRASLYKDIYVDGELVDTVHINSSYYAPAPNYISAGPTGVVAETTPEVETLPEGETLPSEEPESETGMVVNPDTPTDGVPQETIPTDQIPETGEAPTVQVPETSPLPQETVAPAPVEVVTAPPETEAPVVSPVGPSDTPVPGLDTAG